MSRNAEHVSEKNQLQIYTYNIYLYTYIHQVLSLMMITYNDDITTIYTHTMILSKF